VPLALGGREAVLGGLAGAVAETARVGVEVGWGGLGQGLDVFSQPSIGAALTGYRDMPAAAVRAMSETGFSQGQELAHSTETWVEALLELYQSTV